MTVPTQRTGRALRAVAEAVALGASVATCQPQDDVRVLFAPAGHPLSLCRDDG
jgi:hypothetical protein